MQTLTDKKDGQKYELTDNEFRAIYVLVSECLNSMGGDEPSDIHEDPLTWTDHTALIDSGKWTSAEAKGTYGALDKKGLIYIEENAEPGRWEDMVNEFVFDMFQDVWSDIKNNPVLSDLI